MGIEIGVTGSALMQLRHRYLRHALAIGMARFFPGIKLLLVAGLADRGRRDRLCRLERLDGLGHPRPGTTGGNASDHEDEKEQDNDTLHG
jgi:hypothetical protein